jgi:hypothetical protein
MDDIEAEVTAEFSDDDWRAAGGGARFDDTPRYGSFEMPTAMLR